MSPALALGFYIWTEHRRGLIVLGVYWLAATIACFVLPAGSCVFAPDGSVPPWQWIFLVFFAAFFAAVAYLLMIFSFSRQVRIEAREACFPPGLWHLPLPTPALVGWPMLWGSAALVVFWTTLALSSRRLWDFDVPLLWPGLLLAVILAWLQALVWTPFPLPWLRALLLLPLCCLVVYPPVVILTLGVPGIVVSALFVLLLLAGYGTAIRGAARARRGEQVYWGWPAWLRWPWKARTRLPFTSAEGAQLWLEWRRNGLAFPVTVLACCAVWLPLFSSWAAFLAKASLGHDPLVSPALVDALGSLWLTAANLLLLLPLMASGYGFESGKLSGRPRQRVVSSFLATRPLTTAALIFAKWRTAARSTLAGWAALLLGLLLWFAFGGRGAEMAEQFASMRQRHPPALFWGWAILFPVAAIVLTWLQIVQGMGIGLLKNNLAAMFASFPYFVFIALFAFSQWVPSHPEYGVMFHNLLPWLAGAAVVLKCLAAAWSLVILHRRRLFPSALLWGALGLWLVLAAGTIAALKALLPAAWFSVPAVLLGIVLLMPLTRLALAPLALDWNRHR